MSRQPGLDTLDERWAAASRAGTLSEIVGPRSSGRTTVLCRMLRRQPIAAKPWRSSMRAIDSIRHPRPHAGVDLSKLLWVRERGDAPRALKAMNLVLQAGGFGLVAFDVADVPAVALRQFP